MKRPATFADDAPDPPHHRRAGWRHLARRAASYLPDLAAFSVALLCAGLGAVFVGSLGGCGGGVGSEGTGSFSGTSFSSGTITGFGSIVVNGVHFDESTASVQDDDGQSLDRSLLALGMVVQVSAGDISTAGDGRRSATAASVRADRALVGPAAAIDLAAGRLAVLGQAVQVAADTVFDERFRGGLAGMVAGQLLEVYGYYDASSARYTATRIAPAAAGTGYRVSGPVVAVDGAQQFRLGSQAYVGSTAGLSAGANVRLKLDTAPDSSGRWQVSSRRDDDRPIVMGPERLEVVAREDRVGGRAWFRAGGHARLAGHRGAPLRAARRHRQLCAGRPGLQGRQRRQPGGLCRPTAGQGRAVGRSHPAGGHRDQVRELRCSTARGPGLAQNRRVITGSR